MVQVESAVVSKKMISKHDKWHQCCKPDVTNLRSATPAFMFAEVSPHQPKPAACFRSS